MLSLLGVSLLFLSATPASTSPVRQWLNTSSSEAVISSSQRIPLLLNMTATVEQAAANMAYATASDDCEDMSTAADASPTWPAALSTIQASISIADGAYADTQTAPAPTRQHQQASTPDAYASSIHQSASHASDIEGPPPYAVTSLGKHANTTLPTSSGYGAAKPYASSSLEDTTTLTLYTTVASDAGSAPPASDAYGPSSRAGGNTGGTSDHGANAYGGQTTSRAAYTNPSSGPASETRTRAHSGPDGSPVAYGSQSAPASTSSEVVSSYSEQATRTRHRSTRSTHHASSTTTSAIAQYSMTSGQAASSLPPAYPTPDASSSAASSVVVDPVPTTYNPPSQAYSYAPQTSTTIPSADPPILPTSQAYPVPQQSYATDFPWLPTVITDSTPDATETTTSTSSSSSSSSMGGITIVPMDPDAETVYVTVTTTEAGMTSTVAGPTVTEYA